MSGPDVIEERFDDLLAELRATEVPASPELRERVRAIVEREPEPPLAAGRLRPPSWLRGRRRRLALVLVPLGAALAAAVGVGVFSSSGTSRQQADLAAPTAPVTSSAGHGSVPFRPNSPPRSSPSNAFSTQAPAPSGSRAQIYAVDLSLQVADLSTTTKRAIAETRSWGGYVVTVDYGSGQKSGTAYLVLRIPIVKVQTAVAKLTALGTILQDHVSIQDIQGRLNQRFGQMRALKVTIARLRANLTEPNLTASQRAFFEAALAQRQARLASLQEQQTTQKTRASFSTVSIDLQTKKASVAVPSKPGRIGQALHNIGRVLVTEAEILIYVLLIGAPFITLAALLWASRRTLRRRSEEQLLAR
jgi:Domain of unknown function (DUF4349)